MADSYWIIERGTDASRMFVCIVDEAVACTPNRDAADQFDTKADALKVAEVIFSETGATIAVYPLDSPTEIIV